MSSDSKVYDVIIVGAGLAGLTAAFTLQKHSIETVILEKELAVGMPWARRHPQLALNTHRDLSSLPDLPYPEGTAAFPQRDAVIAHLRQFSEKHELPIRHGVEINSIGKVKDAFLLSSSAGEFFAKHVIIATGRDSLPTVPQWKGLSLFNGEVLHAAAFAEARRYAGRDVLVIGGGNSGFDVLNHLSRLDTGNVYLSVRRGPTVLPKRLGRLAVHRLSPIMAKLPTRVVDQMIRMTQYFAFGNLARLGFPPGEHDAATRLLHEQVAIAVDDGAIAAIRSGKFKVVAGVEEFTENSVILSDGRVVRPDIVIAAVGYGRSTEHLSLPEAELRAGLWFIGMMPSLISYFWQADAEAQFIAKEIAKSLRVTP